MRLNRLFFLFVAVLPHLSGAASGQTADLYDENTLRTLEISFQDPKWFTTLSKSFPSTTYFKADLKVDGFTYRDVGVRFRGNTSYRAAVKKKPFKISLDAFIPGQKLYGYRTLNLNNCAFDPSFVREVLFFNIYRRYCVAPRANHVKLKVNGDNYGVYANVQQINKDLGKAWFKDEDGNRYRSEPILNVSRNGGALIWLGSNPVDYYPFYELKSENSTNPWVDLLNLCEILDTKPLGTLESDLPKVLSMDSALWMLAINNALVNPDSYINYVCHNFYLYNDQHHGRIRLLPWDVDHGFSSKHLDNWKMDPNTQITNPKRPLISRVFQIPRWKEAYKTRIRVVLDEFIRWDVLGPMIAKYQALIDAEVKADPVNVHSYEDFRNIVTRNLKNFSGLKPFIETRRQYLLGLSSITKPRPVISDVVHTPGAPTSRDEVWITVRVTGSAAVGRVYLNHRIRGPFLRTEMFDDGQHRDGGVGDGVFGGKISAQAPGSEVEYHIEATLVAAAGEGLSFHPLATEMAPLRYGVQPPPSLVVNEFLAVNERGIRDERGEREDWIELANPTNGILPVSGLYLTDDVKAPTRWQIPPGYSLLPGQILLVWADGEPQEGPLHAPFKLSGGGETLALVAQDGKTLLDRVDYGPQSADVSTGRLQAAPALWMTFPTPTPWAPNVPGAGGSLAFNAPDPSRNTVVLTAHGRAAPGATVRFEVTRAPAFAVCALALSGAPSQFDFGTAGLLLILPLNMDLRLGLTDAEGKAMIQYPVPLAPHTVWADLYAQCFVSDGVKGVFSSAIHIRRFP